LADSPGIKWQKLEADHSPSSTAGVKSVCSSISSPAFFLMAWGLIEARYNFTSTFYLRSALHNSDFTFMQLTLFIHHWCVHFCLSRFHSPVI
jgi:hypothetical protein